MLDLIFKDIVQGRRVILMYLVTGALLGLVLSLAVTGVGSVLGMMAVFSTYGYAVRSTYDEDKNGAMLFLKSLPLSDAAIVVSKYVSTFLVSVVLGAFFLAVAVVGEGFVAPRLGFGTPGGIPDAWAYVGGVLAESGVIFGLVLVMLSVYLTMFFCLGYARAAAYNRFVMLGLFAVLFGGLSVAQKLHPTPPAWVVALGQSSWVPGMAAGGGLALYWLGCLVSVLMVRARDWS